MLRKIIKIDEDKCIGCGLCTDACQEGAIAMVGGKAKLMRDDYCDGLGNCLPVCPVEAISFEEREAAAYDEAAVKNNMKDKEEQPLACGCPGNHSKAIVRSPAQSAEAKQESCACGSGSMLAQWPVQIKLAPVNAPYFNKAKLLIAADCCAYAHGSFHSSFMKGKVTLIGCPKLDDVDYSVKLEEIIKENDIKSVTVVRMEVPCCGGIESAVKNALMRSGKMIPWQIITLRTDGSVKED